MIKVLQTAPTSYPITANDVLTQTFLRTGSNSSDADYTLLSKLIETATDRAERFLRRRLITQTWNVYLDDWPDGDSIYLPYGQLSSITHVKYTDTDGDQTTWSTDEWNTDTDQDPGRVVLEYGYTWPSASLHPQNPIEIQFVCGYGTASSVPTLIKHAIRIAVADLYETRQDLNFSNFSITKLKTFESLLTPYKIWKEI